MRAATRWSKQPARDRGHGGGSARAIGSLVRHVMLGLLAAAISSGVLWLVWIYGSGLRDAHYFDGWILAGGMGFQLYFHVARKTARLTPKSAARWRTAHIYLGYVLIVAFLSHSEFSFPDTAFEWALWVTFVLVAISGVLGSYLAWSVRARHGLDQSISYDRIPMRRAEIARAIETTLVATDPPATAAVAALPGPPHDEWILELYRDHLRDFFRGPRHRAAHLLGSQRPRKRLTEEIDNLARYVDAQAQQKLAAVRELVIEKDGLDFAQAHLGLTRTWLLVHVPVTYSLIVLSVLHVIIVYAYSAGIW